MRLATVYVQGITKHDGDRAFLFILRSKHIATVLQRVGESNMSMIFIKIKSVILTEAVTNKRHNPCKGSA